LLPAKLKENKLFGRMILIFGLFCPFGHQPMIGPGLTGRKEFKTEVWPPKAENQKVQDDQNGNSVSIALHLKMQVGTWLDRLRDSTAFLG